MSTLTLLPMSDRLSASIKEYKLYDYLQADSRPTFIVSISASQSHGQNVDTTHTFYNTSLSNNRTLLNLITRVLSAATTKEHSHSEEATDFLSWVHDSDQRSIWFSDILWSAADIDSSWRIVSGVCLPDVTAAAGPPTHERHQHLDRSKNFGQAQHVLDQRVRHTSVDHELLKTGPGIEQLSHSEVLLSSAAEPSRHQQEMQFRDWAGTELGPIATWPQALFQVVKVVLASPQPAFIHWGSSRNMFWNDAGVEMLRSFNNATPGVSAFEIFKDFWHESNEGLYQEVEQTGRALSLSKSPGPLLERDGGLRETFWTYNYIPLFDDLGSVCGIYALVHDCTTEVLTDGRISTILEINEAMGTATDFQSFWQVVLAELKNNAADIPLAAIYSIGNTAMVDNCSSPEVRQIWQTSTNIDLPDDLRKDNIWYLEGQIGFPDEHACVPSKMLFHAANGLSPVFRQASKSAKLEDVLLSTENGTLPPHFLVGCEIRGLQFKCSQLIACPLQRISGGAIAWLVLGINPRRTFDDEYRRFTRLLSRHIESKLVLILALEKEKSIALKSAEVAAHQQEQLSLRIQQQSHELEQSHARFYNFAKQTMVRASCPIYYLMCV